MISTFEFWKFAADRQDLFFSKIDPSIQAPDNPIFKQYKFTNVYRACDRVSQYLINSVIYNPYYSYNEEDVIFRILLFKVFNKIETWELLVNEFIEDPTLESFSAGFENYVQIYRVLKERGETIFSNAYMMTGSKKFGYEDKAANYLAMLYKLLVEDNAVAEITSGQYSMKQLVNLFSNYELIGPFLAYQFVVDLNYSECLNFDEDDYVMPGGGAIRGIAKIYNLSLKQSEVMSEYLITRMCKEQDKFIRAHGLKFRNLFGRELKLIDIQNIACEVDKALRVTRPDINAFGKSRIKQNYHPSSREKIIYRFPPKWHINEAAASYMNRVGYIQPEGI